MELNTMISKKQSYQEFRAQGGEMNRQSIDFGGQ